MTANNFLELYGLDGVGDESLVRPNQRRASLVKSVKRALKPCDVHGDYQVVGSNGFYQPRFSTDNYLERDYPSFVLANLESPPLWERVFRWRRTRNPLISLAYYPQEDSGTTVTIQYVQSTNRMTREIYDDLKKSLSVNPHEFLLAHFLHRISPVLDVRPETRVSLDSRYVNSNRVYKHLRDRFFDRDYLLNPGKERVRQILGENNSWLQSRK